MYGVYLNGQLMKKCETTEEAYSVAEYCTWNDEDDEKNGYSDFMVE